MYTPGKIQFSNIMGVSGCSLHGHVSMMPLSINQMCIYINIKIASLSEF